MLISITNKCRMGCIHCMDDAKADNEDFMDYDTFIKAIDFNFKYDKMVTITGGEPTEHPQFWQYLSVAAIYAPKDSIITVTTNGMNMDKDSGAFKQGMEMIKKSCKGSVIYQVTSDKRYYPYQINKDNPIFKLPDVVLSNVYYIEPLGRAITNNLPYSDVYIGPKCFNFRSIMRSGSSFQETINILRSRMKFCCPQIAFDGSIKLGEHTSCKTVAHIGDPIDVITDKIRNFKCNDCEILFNKLSPIHKYAIGELSVDDMMKLDSWTL